MSSDWKQWEDLSQEEEEKLLLKLAKALVNRNIGTIAKMSIESGGPLTSLFAEFYMGIYGPYFDFLGVDRYVALLRKKRNAVKLVEIIESLEKEAEEKKHAEKKPPPSPSELAS